MINLLKDMLKDKIVVGAMLVSQHAELLDITIPNLLKWCEWILLVMDNQTQEVEQKIYEFQKQYHKRIFVRRSSIPHKVFVKGKEQTYRQRWKGLKGQIRDEVFMHLRKIQDYHMKRYEKIDILIFQDSDEIFTDYLPELLDNFWNSNYKAITMKPVDVVDDLQTIKSTSKGHHVFIMKWSRELAGLPRRSWALYYPLCHSDLMRVEYYSVHLACLNENIRKWRNSQWKRDDVDESVLYKLDKKITEMRPKEILEVLKV